MEIKISLHLHHSGSVELKPTPELVGILNHLLEGQRTIMATQQEAAAQLEAVKAGLGAKLDKVSAETTGLVTALRDAQTALEAAIANSSNVSPALQAAIDGFGEIVSKAEAVDALVDDVAPNPTPTPTPDPAPPAP